MIDNFVAQPYPLECSFDGGPWALILGWQRDTTKALVVLASAPDRDGAPISYDALQLRYRPATAQRPAAVAPHASSSATPTRTEARRPRAT